jgi:hypothetical protein
MSADSVFWLIFGLALGMLIERYLQRRRWKRAQQQIRQVGIEIGKAAESIQNKYGEKEK